MKLSTALAAALVLFLQDVDAFTSVHSRGGEFEFCKNGDDRDCNVDFLCE